jgi:hypothetical protein
LKGVMPKTLGQWEDGFRFTRFCRSEAGLTFRQRREVLTTIIIFVNTPDGNERTVFKTLHLEAITRDQAQRAIDTFKGE